MNHPGSTSQAPLSEGKRQATPAASFGKKLRYRFDTALAKGPWVVVGWLGLLTLMIILVSAVILTLTGLSGVAGGKSSRAVRGVLAVTLACARFGLVRG